MVLPPPIVFFRYFSGIGLDERRTDGLAPIYLENDASDLSVREPATSK